MLLHKYSSCQIQWQEIIQAINCGLIPHKAPNHEQIPWEAIIYSEFISFRIKLLKVISLNHVISSFNNCN